NVDGKRPGVVQECRDIARMAHAGRQLAQLRLDPWPSHSLHARFELNADHGAVCDPDQRGSSDKRMIVENGLTGDREQRLAFRNHALRLAAAKPKPAAVVEIADVTHAVVETTARRARNLRAL